MARAGLTNVVMVVFCVMLCLIGTARAEGRVDIAPNASFVDLSDQGSPVAANRQNLVVGVPSGAGSETIELQLRSAGPGPEYIWTIFTIRNMATVERKLVLLVEEQRFSGSGLWRLKPFGEKPFGLEMSAAQDTLEREPVQGGDAATFTIAPNSTLSFAIEGKSRITTAQIYSQEAFATREASLAFVRGAAIAVAGLLAFLMLALYGIRKHLSFLAGGFFALTAVGFMAMESGYLGNVMTRLAASGVALDTVRAFAEGTLLVGLTVVFSAFSDLRQRSLVFKAGVALVVVLAIGNLVLAFFAPISATLTARFGFCSVAIAAFVMGYSLRKTSAGPVRYGIVFWSLLLIWVFFAAIVSLTERPFLAQHVALLLGLAIVLTVMAVALVRFAFAQGYLAQPLMTDSSRRSLALAGAQHHVWDWQPNAQKLEIGSELARSLGYDPASWVRNPAGAFLAVLHPDDEPAYAQLLSLRGIAANSYHDLELRLRDAHGQDRWFSLRVRALPGANQQTERCIGTLTDITRNKVTEDRLITNASRDPVTGLPSRAIFQDRLIRELNKSMSLPVIVVSIGLQRFKTFNDGLGHDLGDHLLLVAGQRIAGCLQGDESVSRLSGSQFAVIFIETIAGRSINELVNAIQTSIEQPIHVGNHDVIMTAAIGVSRSSVDGFSDDELQEQASAALAAAQKQGPRSIVYFEDAIDDERSARLELESDLRRAMARGEIEVQYQPIFVLSSGELAGFEALTRWQHPQFGLLPPSKFLPMAEQAGLMRELTDIVLGDVTRRMGIWQRTLIRSRPIFTAINLPADELNDASFVDRLRGMMSREGLRPNALKIEITESMAIRHPDRAQQLIQRLQAIGVGVACDDFGTGFSSLASLRDLPFDTLKIDRSFLQADALAGRGGVILESVIHLAHSLGMVVVGEGIETEEQRHLLIALGCDLGQGYLLGEPLPHQQAQELLVVLPRQDAHASIDEFVSPPPGRAPMAPRAPQASLQDHASDSEERMFDVQDILDSEEPELLPSIFSVSQSAPKTAAKPKATKPQVKVVKKKAVKSAPKPKLKLKSKKRR